MDTPKAFCSIIEPFVNDEPQEDVLNVWVIEDGIVACVYVKGGVPSEKDTL